MKCIQCEVDTINPKFCSRSCAASYNNKSQPKRKRMTTNPCKICGSNILRGSRSFCSHACYSTYRWQQTLEKIETSGCIHESTHYHSSKLSRKYITQKHGYKCSICSISEWQNQKLVLILDHINGKPNDWSITNLRFVCPNCDSQLPTYKSKNKGNGGRPSRRVT